MSVAHPCEVVIMYFKIRLNKIHPLSLQHLCKREDQDIKEDERGGKKKDDTRRRRWWLLREAASRGAQKKQTEQKNRPNRRQNRSGMDGYG